MAPALHSSAVSGEMRRGWRANGSVACITQARHCMGWAMCGEMRCGWRANGSLAVAERWAEMRSTAGVQLVGPVIHHQPESHF